MRMFVKFFSMVPVIIKEPWRSETETGALCGDEFLLLSLSKLEIRKGTHLRASLL